MTFIKHHKLFCSLLLCTVAIISCSKMDAYKEFTTGGEIIYTGKVDSVKTFAGNNRILLTMLLVSDPKINMVKVFWNNKKDSAVKTVQRTTGVDTVSIMLNNMAEGAYTFKIYTYDNAGHSSISKDTTGTVYGIQYTNSLFNRSLKTITYTGSAVTPYSKATLTWYGPSAQMLGEQILYTDSFGVAKNIFSPAKDTLTILPAFKRGNSFQFRTLFKPEPGAIDTFYSIYETRQVL